MGSVEESPSMELCMGRDELKEMIMTKRSNVERVGERYRWLKVKGWEW